MYVTTSKLTWLRDARRTEEDEEVEDVDHHLLHRQLQRPESARRFEVRVHLWERSGVRVCACVCVHEGYVRCVCTCVCEGGRETDALKHVYMGLWVRRVLRV